MRVQQQPAWVLHTRPYSETSLLVDVFSLGHGRLTLMAKGARRLKSRHRALLQPFQALVLGWSGRGELPVLTQCDAAGPPVTLTRERRWCGFYVNELLVRLMHRHDPHPGLFQAYEQGLLALAGPGTHERALRLFEKHLLRELGYALDLTQVAGSGAAIRTEQRYQFWPQRGAVAATPGDPTAPTFSGATLLALDREILDDDAVLRECKLLMRMMISYHLGPKPLHTRKLFSRQS